MRRTGTRCGTLGGYARHRHLREQPCDACIATHNRYMRRYRKRRTSRTLPAIGVARRLRALAVDGFTAAEIADALETATSHVQYLTRAESETVYATTYHHVADLYDRWAGKRGGSRVTAARAVKAGYHPWTAWGDDTIDNPRARPNLTGWNEETVLALMAGEDVPCDRADRVEAAARLAERQVEREDIAARLRVGLSAVRSYIREAA